MKRLTIFIVLASLLLVYSCSSKKVEGVNNRVGGFVCPPCDQSCDNLFFDEDGVCPHCQMNLIAKPDSSLVNDARLSPGAGNFFLNKNDDDTKWVQVFYNAPSMINSGTKVLLVLPGAGRNGHDYRDAWSKASELENVIILALSYPEETYDLGGYHMAGMIDSLTFDGDYHFVQNDASDTWLFNDFDRIFDMVVKANYLDAQTYDLFGHSAGGQILHRYALFFQKTNNANRIIAANSGWYTMPDAAVGLPYGIENTKVDERSLAISYQKKLIVMVGEEDNASETRGSLRKTELANKQGAHRLERAQYFYNYNQELSADLNSDFMWELNIVEGVGHDYRKMSAAAAEILYD